MNKDIRFTMRCERIEPDVPNLNHRIYPASVLQQMVDQIQRKCEIGMFLGRLGTSSETKIRMRDAAFRVLKARIEPDGKLAADIEVLVDTERGRILEDRIRIGFDQLEIVPFGVGSLRDGVVGEDYRLASLDIVQKIESGLVEKSPEGLDPESVIEEQKIK